MNPIDALIENALCSAAIQDGLNPAVLAMRHPGAAVYASAAKSQKGKRNVPWTPEEETILRKWRGYMTETDLGAKLGRTSNAVHIHAERHLRLPAPLKDPRYLSANQVALALGTNGHKICNLIDRGILPAEFVPTESDRRYRRVLRSDLLHWITNIRNWVWFDMDRISDPHLRRLCQLKRERCNDEWWTTKQVAAYHNVESVDVVRAIRLGHIKATQTTNLSGRHSPMPAWANWLVLRSEATRPDLRFIKHDGSGDHSGYTWNDPADSFVLIARAVGVPYEFLAAMIGTLPKRVAHRFEALMNTGRAEFLLADRPELSGIQSQGGKIWADWWLYQQRLPSVARLMSDFAGIAHRNPAHIPPGYMPHRDLRMVRGVLAAFAAYHLNLNGDDPGAQALIKSLTHGCASLRGLVSAYQKLLGYGLDPIGLSS